jgi:geranylgeranyl reductase
MTTQRGLSWLGIVRLGLVQAALGAMVVIATSTMNRVMVVELRLPALVPGLLVALQYFVQVLRPRAGYGSDVGGRRTPWIAGGLAVLALGCVGAAAATALMSVHPLAGLGCAVLAYALVGLGVGTGGTSLLALMAGRVGPTRRAPAATILWLMMIAGIAVTAVTAGRLLDPFSPARLVAITAAVAAIVLAVALLAVRGMEGAAARAAPAGPPQRFVAALRDVVAEPQARRFAIFVFVSMLAYSAQELLLEPFAGRVFGFTPGQSTALTGLQHAGVLAGMTLVAVGGLARPAAMRRWTTGGCLASALALLGLAAAALVGPAWPLRASVVALGVANGAFAVSAIGAMMGLARQGRPAREGMRMGLWGAAQAVAFGLGGLLGTGASDLARAALGTPAAAYAAVFVAAATLFLVAAAVAMRVFQSAAGSPAATPPVGGEEADMEKFDAIVIGGGPAGATAAHDLAQAGRSVLLLDRAGRIKPCGGAIPPRLIRDFAIPDDLLVARVRAARMVAPSDKQVDMPIEGGFVGMVDREHFDEWLRERAAAAGAVRRDGFFLRVEDAADGSALVTYRQAGEETERQVAARVVVGADGARSAVAKQAVKGAEKMPCVFAYHEIVRSPAAGFDGARCDVYYQGHLSPDFYGWVFPHGQTTSVGSGSARKGFSLRGSVGALRQAAGLAGVETIRREGAPIPMKPLKRWDNGRNVVLAGDAAGVVAPASGEGIYYAMVGGRLAAEAAEAFCATGAPAALRLARKRFMREHGRVFWILGIMQWFWYANDKRRERFVSMCRDADVQRLTWDAYMNKQLVRAKPAAHMKIFFKDVAHLFGLVAP